MAPAIKTRPMSLRAINENRKFATRSSNLTKICSPYRAQKVKLLAMRKARNINHNYYNKGNPPIPAPNQYQFPVQSRLQKNMAAGSLAAARTGEQGVIVCYWFNVEAQHPTGSSSSKRRHEECVYILVSAADSRQLM